MSGHGHATEHTINGTCGCCERATVQMFGPDQGVCPDCHQSRCQLAPPTSAAIRDLTVREIRARLALEAEQLCPCGVRPEHCADHRPRPTVDEEPSRP